jgi:hypothetical protein
MCNAEITNPSQQEWKKTLRQDYSMEHLANTVIIRSSEHTHTHITNLLVRFPIQLAQCVLAFLMSCYGNY